MASAILAALGSRDGVPQAAAERSATERAAAADPADRLIRILAGKQLLLVLDNCEHLVDAAAALAGRLLGSCPGVRLLCPGRP